MFQQECFVGRMPYRISYIWYVYIICICIYNRVQWQFSIEADSMVISLMDEAGLINSEITLTVRFDNIQVWKEECKSHWAKEHKEFHTCKEHTVVAN